MQQELPLQEMITQVAPTKPLRKQAYSNILKILPTKYEKFQIKILIFFIGEAVLTSTHNLCFWAEIRKK